MGMIDSFLDNLHQVNPINETLVSYWYEGYCPQTKILLRLPRTLQIEAIATELMKELEEDTSFAKEGKMYGVLLVETEQGKAVLKAFSGLLQGQVYKEGWVPPISGREKIMLAENQTLAELEQIKQAILTLQFMPERKQYQILYQDFSQRLATLNLCHAQRKQKRQEQREFLRLNLQDEALAIALGNLEEQSKQDGIEKRRFKQQRNEVLKPLQTCLQNADQQIQGLKQQRKILSRQLQAQMHCTYSLTNFAGTSLSLQQLMPQGLPTGTGDCCAPKLLHYAATHGYKPLAIAEFWWGSNDGNRKQGQFYGACAERCQPIMGFLLSGLSKFNAISSIFDDSLPIIYEDEWLIAVNKPSGLLSVPGRNQNNQDSVLSRLRNLLPDSMNLRPVHRLDQDASGILLFARDLESYRHLSQQFGQRQIYKIYDAILTGQVQDPSGIINLPLWGDPTNRPYQTVDWQRGKPSITEFRVIEVKSDCTYIEFMPLTGRTHQLRVHAADRQGLGIPILGDRLYGVSKNSDRLCLHARELHFHHPRSGGKIILKIVDESFLAYRP